MCPAAACGSSVSLLCQKWRHLLVLNVEGGRERELEREKGGGGRDTVEFPFLLMVLHVHCMEQNLSCMKWGYRSITQTNCLKGYTCNSYSVACVHMYIGSPSVYTNVGVHVCVYLHNIMSVICIFGVSGSFEVFCVYTFESCFIRVSQFAFRKLLGKGLLSMCSLCVCFSLERGGRKRERERERERERGRSREGGRERERRREGEHNFLKSREAIPPYSCVVVFHCVYSSIACVLFCPLHFHPLASWLLSAVSNPIDSMWCVYGHLLCSRTICSVYSEVVLGLWLPCVVNHWSPWKRCCVLHCLYNVCCVKLRNLIIFVGCPEIHMYMYLVLWLLLSALSKFVSLSLSRSLSPYRPLLLRVAMSVPCTHGLASKVSIKKSLQLSRESRLCRLVTCSSIVLRGFLCPLPLSL